jgi:hypothetical protein
MNSLITQNIRIYVGRLTLGAAVLIVLTALARPVAAQSSDPDHPTPMTMSEVKGRYAGKRHDSGNQFEPRARNFSKTLMPIPDQAGTVS